MTVLETILKLAPNEKEMLSAIAKGTKNRLSLFQPQLCWHVIIASNYLIIGHRPDQKLAAGWTSFLGWS